MCHKGYVKYVEYGIAESFYADFIMKRVTKKYNIFYEDCKILSYMKLSHI